MSKLLKIGIVGCGAIGSSLAKAIIRDFRRRAVLIGLYDRDPGKARYLAVKSKKPKTQVASLKALIDRADLVIEAASATASLAIARLAVNAGKDVMIMSVAGIVNDFKKLERLALSNRARVFIPSGAICGIDGLKASRESTIRKVILTTKKPPRAFYGVPYVARKKINLKAIDKDTVIFEGDALSAVQLFPQNINVAALLSLSGIGPRRTLVRIVASPRISRNTHEIEIESEAGRIFTRTENVVHSDNPKTSYLAVLSAIATLRRILDPIQIGN